VPMEVLGRVGGDRLELGIGARRVVSLSVAALADAFENGLARALDQPIEALGRSSSNGHTHRGGVQ
jgi:hypothetical protein